MGRIQGVIDPLDGYLYWSPLKALMAFREMEWSIRWRMMKMESSLLPLVERCQNFF